MGLVSLLFSFHGRINRRQYWTGNLLAGLVAVVLVVIGVTLIAPDASKRGADLAQSMAAFGLLLLPVSAVMIWCGLAIQVKRFHDRGRTGFLSLLPLLPVTMLVFTVASGAASGLPAPAVAASIQPYLTALWLINLGFFIDLGCLGSREGSNKYGDPPGTPRPPTRFDDAPGAAAAAGFSLGGAGKAIDAAIADRSRPGAAPSAPARQAAPPQPRPAGPAPSFGRRAAR